MTGTRTPATPFDSRPAPSLSFPTSSPTIEPTESDGQVRPVEAITVTTLHGMLARVLEQTDALWQAQASTNRILDELRRSLLAPQESTEIHGRLRHDEALAGTLAYNQRDLHPPAQPGQETSSVYSTYQGRSTPQSVLQPPFVQNVGETLSCNAPLKPRPPPGLITSTQETAHHIDSILHAGYEKYPSLESDVHIRHDENGDEVLHIIPPLGHVDQPTAVISPEQARLPEPQHDSELTIISLPSTIEEDRDRPLGVLDHRVSSTSHVYVPSRSADIVSGDTLHARQERLDAELEPSIPPRRDLDGASTVEPIQRTIRDTTPERAFNPPEVIEKETERNARSLESFAADREHESAHKPDDKRPLSFAAENVPQVTVTERIEALRNQLADLTNLIRQILAFCGEKKVLMEQQWSERLRWKGECGRQIRELMGMASWLVEDRAAGKQREEHQKQTVQDNPRIEQVVYEIQKWNVEHRELFNGFLDTWRAENKRQNEEIISAVCATPDQPPVAFDVQSYLDEFTKALSIEVRMLMGEVGNLREERRRIQHEIGYLMTMQSTLVPGGESGTDWPSEHSSPQVWPSPAGIPLPESPQPRSGWRAVSLRANRHALRPEPSPPPSTAPARQDQSWIIWQPNPVLVPTPPPVEANLSLPDRGASEPASNSPPPAHPAWRTVPSHHIREREPSPPQSPLESQKSVHSWATWQPLPALAPTPPSVEPTEFGS